MFGSKEVFARQVLHSVQTITWPCASNAYRRHLNGFWCVRSLFKDGLHVFQRLPVLFESSQELILLQSNASSAYTWNGAVDVGRLLNTQQGLWIVAMGNRAGTTQMRAHQGSCHRVPAA